MAADWKVAGKTDAGATFITLTAPASNVDLSRQVVFFAVVGVVSAPTDFTFSAGVNAQALVGIVGTTNSWYRVYRITGLEAGEAVTLNIGASAKFMSAEMTAYPGTGIGSMSGRGVKAGSSAQLVLPAFDKTNPASQVVDFWTTRDAGTGGLQTVTDGTIEAHTRGTGSNNTVMATSYRTASTEVTGTFSAASGNGGGFQIEVLPPEGTPTDPPPATVGDFIVEGGIEINLGEAFIVENGVEVLLGAPFIVENGAEVPLS